MTKISGQFVISGLILKFQEYREFQDNWEPCTPPTHLSPAALTNNTKITIEYLVT